MGKFDNKSHTYTLTYCTRSIYLMSLIFYKHFHIACRPSGASGAFTDLALPKSVAACRPPTSQKFTYVAGFHWFNGGPTIETTSNEDIVANCRSWTKRCTYKVYPIEPTFAFCCAYRQWMDCNEKSLKAWWRCGSLKVRWGIPWVRYGSLRVGYGSSKASEVWDLSSHQLPLNLTPAVAFPAQTTLCFNTKSNPDPNTKSLLWYLLYASTACDLHILVDNARQGWGKQWQRKAVKRKNGATTSSCMNLSGCVGHPGSLEQYFPI